MLRIMRVILFLFPFKVTGSQTTLLYQSGKTKLSVRRVYLNGKAKEILTTRLARFDGVFLFAQNDTDGKKTAETVDFRHLKTIRRLVISSGWMIADTFWRHGFSPNSEINPAKAI